MKNRDRDLEGRGLIPPYGPTRGTIQALDLMRRMTPPRIDSDYLRLSKIAPGNEYKAVGALKFLGLIDEEGKPTEASRVLKTKGAAYTLGLQDIVRKAYAGIFNGFNPNKITREEIYNYFVTQGGLGAEMATKATRFLIKLCRQAEIEIAPDVAPPLSTGKRRPRSQRQAYRQHQYEQAGQYQGQTAGPVLHLTIAATPETAKMDDEELTELFRRMRRSLEQSLVS